jgi:3-keto-5-aminohexanoate cleavage enzyme
MEAFDPNDYMQWLKLTSKQSLPPLIITVAVTGGVQGKETHPDHPESAAEQVEQIYECYKLGATQVHLHVRNPKALGFASGDPKEYFKVNGMIREKCPEIIINNTTGGGLGMEPTDENRLAPVLANPETCSLDMGRTVTRFTLKKRLPPLTGTREQDVDFEAVQAVSFKETEKFAKLMLEHNVKPEMELWSTGDYDLVNNLIEKKLIQPPYLLQAVMGYSSGARATPAEVMHLVGQGPKEGVYSVLGVGLFSPIMCALGILLGINVRTGMEDTILYKKGELCKNNAQLVERVVRMARDMGRDIATPKQARQMMGLSEKPTQYG